MYKSKTNRGCSKFHEQLKINHIWIKGRIHMKNISKDKLKKYERSFNQNENKVITNTVTKNGFFKSCENYDEIRNARYEFSVKSVVAIRKSITFVNDVEKRQV